MLGIRHFKGSAIDLYLGDITEFCSDVIVTACNPDLSPRSQQDKSILLSLAKDSFDNSNETEFKELSTIDAGKLPCTTILVTGSEDVKDSISSTLSYTRRHKLRHVSFPLWLKDGDISKTGQIFFSELKEFLALNEGPELRVTVVLNLKEDYFKFQDEMFATFPEENK